MKILLPAFLLFAFLTSIGQTGPIRNWVDSEKTHTDSKGNSVKFIHSLPKGGGLVYKNGKKYGYVVFWTRVINQSATPLEVKANFPEITYFKSPESYIHIILPKEPMHIEKVQLYDYGLKNLESIFNLTTNQLPVLQEKINPKEEYLFYITVFIHTELRGAARAKFELKGQDLIYKISMGSDTTVIPCGSLAFKK
jgi:hypothetical protein